MAAGKREIIHFYLVIHLRFARKRIQIAREPHIGQRQTVNGALDAQLLIGERRLLFCQNAVTLTAFYKNGSLRVGEHDFFAGILGNQQLGGVGFDNEFLSEPDEVRFGVLLLDAQFFIQRQPVVVHRPKKMEREIQHRNPGEKL